MCSPAFDDEMESKSFVRWFFPPGIDDMRNFERGLHRVRPIAQETWVGPFTRISWDHQIATVNPKRRNQTNSMKPRRALDIIRQGKEGDDASYYLRWVKKGSVTVNGVLCDNYGRESFAVGPLPEYAIIQIEEAVIFWWRNEVALDYVPEYLAELEQDDGSLEPESPQQAERLEESVGQQRTEVMRASEETPKEDEAQNEQETNEGETWSLFNDEFDNKCLEWQRIFAERMQSHRDERERDERWKRYIGWENGPSTSPCPIHQFTGQAKLEGEDVVLSIASLWQAMRSEHDDSAFSSYNLFQVCHLYPSDAEAFAFPISSAVGGHNSKHLIIPIIAGKNDQASRSSEGHYSAGQNTREPSPTETRTQATDPNQWIGEDSHILLAIATRPTDPDDPNIQYEIFDSCPGYLKPATIERAVQNTVNRSGWLARDAEGFACAPPNNKPIMIQTPRHVPAQVSINSCGIHAILNAWVHILKLAPVNSTGRCGSDEDFTAFDPREIEFIENAAEMINLALAGHMDTLTIRAFVMGWGYCQVQDPENPEPLKEISTVLMTSRILEDIIERHRQEYIEAQAQGSGTSQ